MGSLLIIHLLNLFGEMLLEGLFTKMAHKRVILDAFGYKSLERMLE